jgi:hypothetical protein
LLIQLAVLLAAIVPGATNNRILVLGPKAKTATEDVRLAAVAALASSLEKQRMISRRLQDGNLVDLSGKKLLRDPIGVQLRSLLQAGCEGAVCGETLRNAFSALGGVARVRIKPLGEKGGLVTVWISGLRADGAFAKRKERSVVLAELDLMSVSKAVTELGMGLHTFKARADGAPATMVVPEVGAAKKASAPKGLTGLAPWKVVADADRKSMQAELEKQQAAEAERIAKIEAEKQAALDKMRKAEEANATELAAKASSDAKKRKADEQKRIADWKKGGLAGEVGLSVGPSLVSGADGVATAGNSIALVAQLRLPLGTPGIRLGVGFSAGTLPTHSITNSESGQDEAWMKLSHPDEATDEAGEEFWYQYEYVRFIQLDGRLDVQFGNAPVGAFVGGGLGLNLSHGQVHNLQFDVNQNGESVGGTGTPRRDPSDAFTWPSLQTSFGAGVWFQAPSVPITLTLGYKRYMAALSGLRTMARPVNGQNEDRVFSADLAREVVGADLTYRF